MTKEEIVDGLEIYTVGRPRKDRVQLQKYIDAIKALEQTRWIPISERNPNKNGKYLVTVRGLMGEYVKVETIYYAEDLYKIDKFDFIDKQGVAGWYFFESEWGYYEFDNVVAWMPLPQAYGAGSEEKV